MEQYSNITIHLAFFGTHDFAAIILQALLDDPRILVDLVITQPDKPTGRKQILAISPVKQMALKHHIPVEQPARLNNIQYSIFPPKDGSAEVADNIQLGIAVQYGLLIPKHILESFPHGILNIHPSLLPKYRGASPIQSALINGETETGVTIMKMDEGLDTGPILAQETVAIGPDETYPELAERLAPIAARLLIETIPKYVSGELQPIPQDSAQATICKELTREDGKIDWRKSARKIYNQYRGMTPWPGLWTMWGGKRLKLLRIKLVETQDVASLRAGTVHVENDRIYIGCKEKAIEALELQLEGKNVVNASTFLHGHSDIRGQRLM